MMMMQIYKDRFDVSTERPNQCWPEASLPAFLNVLQVETGVGMCVLDGKACEYVVVNITTFNFYP